MEFLKDIFGDGAKTHDEFMKEVEKKGLKIADLSKGGYVDEKKHRDELRKKEAAYNKLQEEFIALSGGKGAKPEDRTEDKPDNELMTAIAALKEQIAELKGKQSQSEEKASLDARKSLVKAAGVQDKYLDDVALLVGNRLTEGQDFSEALEAYVKDNPVFKQQGATSPKMTGNPKDNDPHAWRDSEGGDIKLNPIFK